MPRPHSFSILSLLCLLCSTFESTAQNPSPKPTPIFDGHTFANWDHQDSHWSIEDNAITGTIPDAEQLNRNLFLFYKGEVHDFELELDFKVTGHPSANSGVQFRCVKTDHGAAGYQADIDDGAVWLGRIYDEHGRALIAERG
ncbi:MAG: DUF1080 domain-containing protein, partial [Verrucomicrobiales bacterium]|nr:DUF1080 domain-containing protein [Verrucomicrobiales bacterium]